jgi:hypothetical protein
MNAIPDQSTPYPVAIGSRHGEGRGEADRAKPGVEFLAPDEGSFAKAVKGLV